MSVHVYAPPATNVTYRMWPCPVCREPEPCRRVAYEWHGPEYEWRCGTTANDDGYRRPRQLIVDSRGRRPEWLRQRDRGW